MAYDHRGRAKKGGGTSLTHLIISALAGGGSEATPNMPVDAEAAPEFEGGFTTPRGEMVSQPFSGNPPNFWGRLLGQRDEAADLNNKIALQRILGSQEGQQALELLRAKMPLELEQAEKMGDINTTTEVKRRRALIPVGEEETRSKNKSELEQTAALGPVKAKNTALEKYAGEGILPEDTTGLSTLAAAGARVGSQNRITGQDLIRSVLTNQENTPLLQGGILAERAQPIATLRNALETGVPANTSLYRDAIGNPTLDRLINPGIYTGNITTQEPAAHIPLTINGQTVMFPIGEKSSVVRPGGFRPPLPAFDPVKAKAALEAVQPSGNRVLSVTPAESGIKTNAASEFKVGKQPPTLQPVNPTGKEDWKWKDPQVLQSILEWILKGGATDVMK